MTKAEEVRALMGNAQYDELLVKIEKAATAKKPKSFIEVGDLSYKTIDKLKEDGFIVDIIEGLEYAFDEGPQNYIISW